MVSGPVIGWQTVKSHWVETEGDAKEWNTVDREAVWKHGCPSLSDSLKPPPYSEEVIWLHCSIKCKVTCTKAIDTGRCFTEHPIFAVMKPVTKWDATAWGRGTHTATVKFFCFYMSTFVIACLIKFSSALILRILNYHSWAILITKPFNKQQLQYFGHKNMIIRHHHVALTYFHFSYCYMCSWLSPLQQQ